MNLTRLREDLSHYLQWHQNGHSEPDPLLDALERKDAALKRRLDTELQPHKRRHLEIEPEVTRLQHSKGVELRHARR